MEAPTGTVTLVFTDVQGSTALWDRVPGAMRQALTLHDELMRETLIACGGYEVKTEGDAFMVAFQSGQQAVEWCLCVQERLMVAPWPEAILAQKEASEQSSKDGTLLFRGLRVRMGAHSGEPICQPDPNTGRMDYFGGMVNRAARVGGAGHGGQILISGSVVYLGDVGEVVDLGEHRLKGLEQHERLQQILPKILKKRRFPKIKTIELKKSNLSYRVDRFVGRVQDLDELKQRIDEGHRLITGLGLGGVGKTSLYRRFGHRILGEFSGGVWFVDLSRAQTLEDVWVATAVALDVQLSDADPQKQLGYAIRGRECVLIIFDNFEQIVQVAGETLADWLHIAPKATFLVASQVALRIEGEDIFDIEPLSIDDAMELFFDRASAIQKRFSRTPKLETTVRQIVAQLDQMPLAIELAAARIRMLSAEQILQRLDQRFKLLRGSRKGQNEHQATLRSAIDWSWSLLQPVEQLALSQLAVFEGGCTLEAAEAIIDLEAVDPDLWVMDVLEKLVDHSLLRQVEPIEGHVRYQMTKSVQIYALEKGVDERDVRRRHAQYYAQLGTAESIRCMGHVDRSREALLEIDNCRAAVEAALEAQDFESACGCALVVGRVALWRGPFGLTADWLQRVVNKVPHGLARARLQPLLSNLLLRASDVSQAYEIASTALEEAEKLLDMALQIEALFGLSLICEVQGHRDQQIKLNNRSEKLLQKSKIVYFQIRLWISRSNLEKRDGAIDQSISFLEQAQKLARQTDDHRAQATILNNLGGIYFDIGRFESAEIAYLDAKVIYEQLHDQRAKAILLNNISGLMKRQERLIECLDYAQQAITLAKEMGNPLNAAIFSGNLGLALYEDNEPIDAERYLTQAIDECDEFSHPASGAFRSVLAMILGDRDQFSEARELLAYGEQQLRGVHALQLALLQSRRAIIEAQAGASEQAETALTEAESIAQQLGSTEDSELMLLIAQARSAQQ